MHLFRRVWPILVLLAISLGCQSGGAGLTPGSGPSGNVYYAKFTIQVDRNFCRSTNYRNAGSGVTIPINGKVEFVSSRRHRFAMLTADGQSFTFEHLAKHTRDSPAEAFDSFFSAEPIDLSSFSATERTAIEAGRVEIGMSRAAVLAASGPPPAIGTPSLENLVWKYWHNRWATFTIRFDEGGRVVAINR
jgi:hypothetical protein